MERETVFLSYVRYIFKKWTGLQAAIEDGMGGPYAKEKEVWLGNEVEKYFKRYSDVRPEDIEDYMATMIENEFETYFEDGSLLEIAQKFCNAYELSLVNPDAELFQESCRKVETNQSQNCNSKPNINNKETSQEMLVTSKMENLTVNGETEDDGWTTVTKKGKKNK